MIHSTDDINAAVAANSKKLQLSKGAQEFTNRVMSTSAISSTSGLPDGAFNKLSGHLELQHACIHACLH